MQSHYYSSLTAIPLAFVFSVPSLNVSIGPAVGGTVMVLLLLAVIVCVLIWQHHKRPQHKGTAIGNKVYEGACI